MILILRLRKKVTQFKKKTKKQSPAHVRFYLHVKLSAAFPTLAAVWRGSACRHEQRTLNKTQPPTPAGLLSCVDTLLANGTQPNPYLGPGVGGLPSCVDILVVGKEPDSLMSTSCLRELIAFEGNQFTFSQRSFELPKK